MTRAQRRVAQAYARVFATAEGQVVLADLIEEFETANPLLGGSAEQTGANVGMFNVVRSVRAKLAAGRETPRERRRRQPPRAVTQPPKEGS